MKNPIRYRRFFRTAGHGWRKSHRTPGQRRFCGTLPKHKRAIITFADYTPPCFYFDQCGRRAEFEKQGKSVCARCAGLMRGQTYPLRSPADPTPYHSTDEILRAYGYA